ncbi:MAG TPA: hypothetical protein VK172_09230, partial [Lentimicrobium sp.]|nr:hypothetical protein [Lentimicrobium sp.]
MKAKPIIRFQLSILLFIIPIIANAQGKEANNWYFGQQAGITFQQGSPPIALTDGITNSPSWTGTACMSDKDGNLLFYSDGVTIWNKNHQVMTNGNNMGTWSTQGAMIVQDPGNENRYYFFNQATTGTPPAPMKLQYSIIDMTVGLGQVVPEKKGVFLYLNVTAHLSAVLHENMNDVWVVGHGLGINNFIAFKITSDSIITQQLVISYAGTSYNFHQGYMKISSDGKWIGVGNYDGLLTELYHFNNATGVVSNQNVVSIPMRAFGVEFSPDNKKFYAHGGYPMLFQYDLSSNDPTEIINSQYLVTNEMFGSGALQLGPDGQIYVGHGGYYLSVIHDPDKKGLLCNFEYEAIYLEGKSYLDGLPVFMQSYMRNPEFTSIQKCSGQPTQFNIVNTNGIDSVFWKFHDPGNAPNDTSTLFAPLYTFSTADTFYVELTAYSGLLHRTVIDTVIIYQTPDPDFGPDTTFCANEPISLPLDAGPGELYFWNGFNPGGQTYYVTSPGQYTVRVLNHGCAGRDTINVIQFPEPIVDTTNTNYNNASCGQPDGDIEGVTYSGAITGMEWKNSSGTTVGTGIDLIDVPAGIYTLYVYYGDSCAIEPIEFEIENNSAPQIMSVTPGEDHCNQGNGRLTIVAVSSLGDPLAYSINGGPFNASNVFTGLNAGDYTVTVMDVNNCTDNYSITLDNIPGPAITGSGTTPEDGY